MFSIYDRNDWNNIVWKTTFEVPESPKDFSSWEVIKIPFENFISQRRGELVDARDMDLHRIEAF